MEIFADKEVLSLWLVQYGSIAIFGLLVLGIIALPVPEETLMVLAGFLMSSGKISIGSTMIATYAGSMCGITSSYIIGRTTGYYLIHKYGRWCGLTEGKLRRAEEWFSRYGKWTLTIGYFIPGVRHLTGLSAGATHLSFRQFALFAYTGAVFWVSTFLSIGYFFGDYWSALFEEIEVGADWLVIILVLALAAYVAYLVRKKQKRRNR